MQRSSPSEGVRNIKTSVNDEIQEFKQTIGQQAEQIIASGMGLQRVGTKYRCPDKAAHSHGDRTPSISWYKDGCFFKCFGCGKVIDIYGYYTNYKNLSHKETMQMKGGSTVQEYKIEVKEQKQKKIFHLDNLKDFQRDYLKKRGLSDLVVDYFKLGNVGGNIGIPYIANGEIRGIKYKNLAPKGPKYKSVTGSQMFLLNRDNLDANKPLYITEGEFDALALAESTNNFNVASIGYGATSLNKVFKQEEDFFNQCNEIIVIGDNDDPGQVMNQEFFKKFGSKCKFADYELFKGHKDINEVLLKEGSDQVQAIVASAKGREVSELDEEPYYLYEENGKQRVNTALLSKFINESCRYLIVRKNGFDQDFLYWYQEGHYKRISPNEFKGKIKEFIPLAIRKASQYEEVYKQLITDKTTVKVEELDQDERYINFKNGLYNIQTKSIEQHTPDLLSTIQINAEYKSDSDIPEKWLEYLRFLTEYDESLMAVLQEWVGLTISNIPGFKPKKAMALYGPNGNNGKSVFINILDYLIGTENIATRDIQELTKPFATSDLYGKKALLIDDQREADFADSSIFKSITGGGLVACEFKGKQSFSYRFNGTVTFGCNELPYLAGEKGSHIFERLMIIPCFNVLNEDDRDPLLTEKLRGEIDGIVAWAIEGLHRLIGNGFKFTKSDATEQALQEYRMRSDSLYRYVIENCVVTNDKDDKISKSEFEDDYERWANINEITAISKRNIKDRAQKIGIKFGKISNFYYIGVRYKAEAEDRNEEFMNGIYGNELKEAQSNVIQFGW